jgi:myo-inositol 2-dehydrogenase / D-chiro-inositol 1-dehydrogenase
VGLLGSPGMVAADDIRQSSMTFYGTVRRRNETIRLDTELLHGAYTDELALSVDCIRTVATPKSTGSDAREALAIALAAIRSVQNAQLTRLEEMEVG